jgi:hypothetical protein
MKMKFTADDLRGSLVLDPNWYPAVVRSVEIKAAKTDSSTNWNYRFEILSGKGRDGKDYAGVMIYRLFNEKAMRFARPFVEALGIQLKDDDEFDPNSAVGKKLLVYVKNEEYEGKLQNRVADFRPIG